MHNTLLKRFLNSCSNNLKSKTCPERGRSIENPKWVGLLTIGVTLAFCGAVAQAQQLKKMPRVGYLSPFSPASEPNKPIFEAFHQGLRELGWIPGNNVNIEYRWAEEKYNRLPELAAELVRLDVDVIYTLSALPALYRSSLSGWAIP